MASYFYPADERSSGGALRARPRCLRSRTRGRRYGLGYGLGAAAAAGIFLAGCQGLDMSTANVAQVRVIAASPDSPQMDFYLGGNALAYGVDFGSMSSYVPLMPGNVTISANTANSKQLLVTTKAALVAGQQYTAVVTNVAANLQETVYVDQTTPAPPGNVAVRVIDAGTRTGNVDIYLVPSSGKLDSTFPVRTGVSFGSSTGYILEPAGTYSLVALPAGTVPNSSTEVLLRGPEETYAAGSVRTVVLVDHAKEATPVLDQIVASDYDPD